MFTLPNNVVKEVISGERDYNEVCTISEEVEENEVKKGYRFEDQARVNLTLQDNYKPVCIVLEEECKKEGCVLYHEGKMGKLEEGWVCREYKIDFPEAKFDSRYHQYTVGINNVDFEETVRNLEQLKEKGAEYICLNCKKPYQKKREELYEDGHGGRMLEMCNCGCDLFEDISSFIESCGENQVKI